MMRKLIAVALAFGVHGMVLSAPLVHAHRDGHDTDHHRAHAVHAHLGGHMGAFRGPVRGPAVDDDDHDPAVYLQLFVSEARSTFSVPLAAVPSFDLIPPQESPAHRSVDVAHGHDPPFNPSSPSRAPPAFPVLT
jgi:hypothetical protein